MCKFTPWQPVETVGILEAARATKHHLYTSSILCNDKYPI